VKSFNNSKSIYSKSGIYRAVICKGFNAFNISLFEIFEKMLEIEKDYKLEEQALRIQQRAFKSTILSELFFPVI
jgi:hypothetical protein